MTPLTLVRLLATVHALVALQMVLLDEAHITDVTLERLLTSVNEDVPLEVVTAPEGAKAVFASEILGNLYLERTILLHYHHLRAPEPGQQVLPLSPSSQWTKQLSNAV